MLFQVLAATAMAAATPASASDEAAARNWLAAAGHPFAPDDVSNENPEALVDLLSGAKVVGIGEATHGTHQDQAFKGWLIRALVRAGAIDTIALECNRAAGQGFDRYVRFGEGDPIAALNSPSSFRVLTNEAFAGLLVWLRAWNAAHAATMVRIIGIDDQDSARDADFALGFAERHDRAKAQLLRARMGSLPQSGKQSSIWAAGSNRQEFDRAALALDDLTSLISAHPEWKKDAQYNEALYASRVARQGLRVFDQEVGDVPTGTRSASYYSRRDRFMATNLIERLGTGRAAFWAHDEHVSKYVTDHFSQQGFTSVGAELRARFGEGYKTVGFTYSQAAIAASTGDYSSTGKRAGSRNLVVSREPNDRPGELGEVFASLPSQAMWIDIHSRPHSPALDRFGGAPYWRGWTGWYVDPAKWQTALPDSDEDGRMPVDRGFDILVWFRNLSPAQALPAVQ